MLHCIVNNVLYYVTLADPNESKESVVSMKTGSTSVYEAGKTSPKPPENTYQAKKITISPHKKQIKIAQQYSSTVGTYALGLFLPSITNT